MPKQINEPLQTLNIATACGYHSWFLKEKMDYLMTKRV